jgi:hypothetical protein
VRCHRWTGWNCALRCGDGPSGAWTPTCRRCAQHPSSPHVVWSESTARCIPSLCRFARLHCSVPPNYRTKVSAALCSRQHYHRPREGGNDIEAGDIVKRRNGGSTNRRFRSHNICEMGLKSSHPRRRRWLRLATLPSIYYGCVRGAAGIHRMAAGSQQVCAGCIRRRARRRQGRQCSCCGRRVRGATCAVAGTAALRRRRRSRRQRGRWTHGAGRGGGGGRRGGAGGK